MKRSLIAILALMLTLVLALSLAGCGGGADGTDTGATGTGTSGGSADELVTIDDLRAALERDHASAEWYGDITDITVETWLGAPVLVVHVGWDMQTADFEVTNRKQQGVIDALFAYQQSIAPNSAIMLADGSFTQAGGSSTLSAVFMTERFALPPAPQTAEEVQAWLATVYGPGGLVTLGPGETWYSAITSITMEELGSGPNLVVRTTAPSAYSTDASLIQMALLTTGSPLLTSFYIEAADGSGSAVGSGPSEPGSSGWLYLSE